MAVIAVMLLIILLGPIIELIAGVIVASYIGWAPTILLALVCSIVGVLLLKVEGIAALRRVQHDLRRGKSPGQGLVDGLLRMTGTVLLAVPGLVSALVGILLLLPPVRALLTPVVAAGLASRAISRVSRMRFGTVVVEGGQVVNNASGGRHAGEVIEAEGWDVEDRLPLTSGDPPEL